MSTKTPSKPQADQIVTSAFTGQPLKPAFQGVQLTRGYHPRPPERARILLMGLRKSGKSTFAVSHPGCCVLDFEGGCAAIPHPRAYIAGLTDCPAPDDRAANPEWYARDLWDRYQQVKSALLADAKTASPQFTTVAFDSVDFLLSVIIDRFCREHELDSITDYKGRGAGWFEVASRLLREIDDMERAGYGLILNTHQVEKTFSHGENTWVEIKPCLIESARRELLKRVDQIMHIGMTEVTKPRMETVTIDGKPYQCKTQEVDTIVKVVLRTIPLGNDRERGCRVAIPDKLELPPRDAWAAYADAYNAEVERQQAAQIEEGSRDAA